MNVRTLRPLTSMQQQGGRGGGQQQDGRGRGQAAFTTAPGAPLPGPPAGINAAKHAAVRARTPVRRIYDRYPQYSAVAVGPTGNAEPTWKLRTPMGSFGLSVDEEREELLITGQHEQVVAAYSKTARDNDLPNWVLWGDKTELADPHGIAIDTKQKVYFVANFG